MGPNRSASSFSSSEIPALAESFPPGVVNLITGSGPTVIGPIMQSGLVDALADDPSAAALAYFEEHLAKRSAGSLRLAVRAARYDFVYRIRRKLAEVERLYLEELMATHDAVEGLTAFIAKRPAVWEDS